MIPMLPLAVNRWGAIPSVIEDMHIVIGSVKNHNFIFCFLTKGEREKEREFKEEIVREITAGKKTIEKTRDKYKKERHKERKRERNKDRIQGKEIVREKNRHVENQ